MAGGHDDDPHSNALYLRAISSYRVFLQTGLLQPPVHESHEDGERETLSLYFPNLLPGATL